MPDAAPLPITGLAAGCLRRGLRGSGPIDGPPDPETLAARPLAVGWSGSETAIGVARVHAENAGMAPITATDLPPWSAICRLVVEFPSCLQVATGWLAGRTCVVVAAEAIWRADLGGAAQRVRVEPGADETGRLPFGAALALRAVHPAPPGGGAAAPCGIAALELDRPIGALTGTLTFGALIDPALPRRHANVAGYAADAGAGVGLALGRGPVTALENGHVRYAALVPPGFEGAPLLLRETGGAETVAAGLHLRAAPDDAGGSVGLRLTPERFRRLLRWSEAGPGAEDAVFGLHPGQIPEPPIKPWCRRCPGGVRPHPRSGGTR